MNSRIDENTYNILGKVYALAMKLTSQPIWNFICQAHQSINERWRVCIRSNEFSSQGQACHQHDSWSNSKNGRNYKYVVFCVIVARITTKSNP